MVCIVEFNDGLRFNFAQNKCKQKVWIEILLRFSKADMNHLANLLELPVEKLIEIHRGKQFLEKEQADILGKLFLVTFGD
ncbi:hypothetical protein [Legionella genomosp. 1]|uniref:hypothetical protein n=1 Tax=Legionella genomosp. 1 TaxID=1093625 RepID=UPI0010560335|nr:hypothetical protein [Legionella genomosp. 1]